MPLWDELSEGMQWVVVCVVCFILFMGAMKLLIPSHGGVANCGPKGVQTTTTARNTDNDPVFTIVCRDGKVFQP